jgi:hypothetical protein
MYKAGKINNEVAEMLRFRIDIIGAELMKLVALG